MSDKPDEAPPNPYAWFQGKINVDLVRKWKAMNAEPPDPIEQEARIVHERMADRDISLHRPHDAGGCGGCYLIAAALRATEARVREEVLADVADDRAAYIERALLAKREALLEAADFIAADRELRERAMFGPAALARAIVDKLRAMAEEQR